VIGFVNAIAIAKSGKFLLAGIGREHRLGRWFNIKVAKHGLLTVPLNLNLEI